MMSLENIDDAIDKFDRITRDRIKESKFRKQNS